MISSPGENPFGQEDAPAGPAGPVSPFGPGGPAGPAGPVGPVATLIVTVCAAPCEFKPSAAAASTPAEAANARPAPAPARVPKPSPFRKFQNSWIIGPLASSLHEAHIASRAGMRP